VFAAAVTIIVQVVLFIAGVYVAAGLLFAVPFVVTGVQRVDGAARGSTWGFRMIIIPGVIVLWPWLAWCWRRGGSPVERTAHRNRVALQEVSS
jgi:hypothetical protein